MASYVGTRGRVIGGAIEVADTTPDLYQGGSLVAYSFSSDMERGVNLIQDSSSGEQYSYTAGYIRSRPPPSSVQDAMNIPGSVKWKSREGAYAVLRASKNDNPPVEPVYAERLFINGTTRTAATPTFGFGVGQLAGDNIVIAPANPSTTLAGAAVAQCVPLPYDNHGIYLTGLQQEAVIEVTCRWYVEQFPAPYDTTLVSLQQPCAPYDPNALEIYSRIANEIPVAVTLDQNETGGWWNGLMTKIASLAPTIGSALGTVIPGAGLIGTGVGKAAELLAGMRLGEKAQKEVDQRKEAVETRVVKRMTQPSPNARNASTKKRAYALRKGDAMPAWTKMKGKGKGGAFPQ